MTDREKAIVMAYTRICMLTGDKFQIYQKYVEDIMGRPVWTHEIGWLENEIKEKSKADFIALCADESSLEIPNTCGDAISRKYILDLIDTKGANLDDDLLIVEQWIQDAPSVNPHPIECGDAISRQAVLNLMRGLTRWCIRSEDGKWKNVGLLYDDVMFGIDRLPSVTPQQRMGRWVKEGQGGRYKWMCSNCGTHHRALYDYCPSCGTRMEVEE